MKIIVVCEAAADFRLASCLLVRSLRQHGPRWLEDLPEVASFSGWTGSDRAEHAKWPELDDVYLLRYGRPLHGRKNGPYSKAATKAILLAEREPDLGALVLMVDLDREPERRKTFERLREEAAGMPFTILLATPDPEREAWVLHGFEPADKVEESRLTELSQSLGFDPRLEPHRLRDDARRRATLRDIKQVLDHLTRESAERQNPCWENCALENLEARGRQTYLTDFLSEIRSRLLPRIVGQP